MPKVEIFRFFSPHLARITARSDRLRIGVPLGLLAYREYLTRLSGWRVACLPGNPGKEKRRREAVDENNDSRDRVTARDSERQNSSLKKPSRHREGSLPQTCAAQPDISCCLFSDSRFFLRSRPMKQSRRIRSTARDVIGRYYRWFCADRRTTVL